MPSGSRRRRQNGEAIVGAVADFNRRMRMLELAKYAGTCTDLITPQELQAARGHSPPSNPPIRILNSCDPLTNRLDKAPTSPMPTDHRAQLAAT